MARLPDFELGVCGKKPLVVGRASKSLFASGRVESRPVGCCHLVVEEIASNGLQIGRKQGKVKVLEPRFAGENNPASQ